MTNNAIYQKVSQAIQQVTGLEENEIRPDFDLAEDLSINPISDLPMILKLVNQELDVELPLDQHDFIAEAKKSETVAELADLIENESEF